MYFLNNFFYRGAFESLTPYTVGRAWSFEPDQKGALSVVTAVEHVPTRVVTGPGAPQSARVRRERHLQASAADQFVFTFTL